MASNYQPAQPQWILAVRFLTLGTLAAAVMLSIWWITRLADHLENQRALLVSIQRDVLVNQAQVKAALAIEDQNGRRLVNVEERMGRASEDRQSMRAFDQQMTEALIRLRGTMDDIREQLGEQPPDDEPGPKARQRR